MRKYNHHKHNGKENVKIIRYQLEKTVKFELSQVKQDQPFHTNRQHYLSKEGSATCTHSCSELGCTAMCKRLCDQGVHKLTATKQASYIHHPSDYKHTVPTKARRFQDTSDKNLISTWAWQLESDQFTEPLPPMAPSGHGKYNLWGI